MAAMKWHRSAVGADVVVTLALLAGTIWLVLISWGNPVADAYYWRPVALLNTLVWLTFVVVGALIWLRKPANSVGWILSAIGLFMLTISFIEEYSVRGLLVEPGSLPTANGLAISGQFLWTIPIGLVPILMLVYPTGRFISRGWLAATAPTAIGILAGVVSTVLIWPHWHRAGEFLLAEEAPVDLPVVDVLMGGTFILWMIGLAAGVAALVVRWRAGDPVVRRQIKLLLFASTVLTLVLVAYNLGFGAPTTLVGELIIRTALVLPLAIAVAILRYRLYDIDRIISRTVTYGLVVAVLAAVYATGVFAVQAVSPASGNLGVATSTLAAAALFAPLRRRVQKWVDRRFDRRRYDAARVVEEFGHRLRTEVNMGDLSRELETVVAETMQPVAISMWFVESEER